MWRNNTKGPVIIWHVGCLTIIWKGSLIDWIIISQHFHSRKWASYVLQWFSGVLTLTTQFRVVNKRFRRQISRLCPRTDLMSLKLKLLRRCWAYSGVFLMDFGPLSLCSFCQVFQLSSDWRPVNGLLSRAFNSLRLLIWYHGCYYLNEVISNRLDRGIQMDL